MGYVSSAMYDSKLPGLLRRLRADWPGIELSLVQGMCKCSTKRCWICVWISPSSARRWPRRRTRWWSGRLYVKSSAALYQQHPLAGVGALNLASLRTDNWISLDDPQGTGLEQVFMDACRVAGFTPQVAQRINDVTSMISLVSAGVGVALVPLSARALRLDNVVYIDLGIGWRRVS